MRYGKLATSYAQQLEQLKRRGLLIPDEGLATRYLERAGYYRMMGYLFPLRADGSDDFRAGASFGDAADLYEFDHVLRLHVMDAIAGIEVAIRAALVHRIGHEFGAFGHVDPACFTRGPAWQSAWVAGLDDEVRRAKEPFLEHYRGRYDDPSFPRVPVWMAFEVASLGRLSRLLDALSRREQKAVAERFDLPAPILVSWLHAMCVVRNIAAHHGRLWNRVFGVKPMRPRHGGWQSTGMTFPNDRTYFMLLVLKTLLRHTVRNVSDWTARLIDHLQSMASHDRFRQGFGAPVNWADHPLLASSGVAPG